MIMFYNWPTTHYIKTVAVLLAGLILFLFVGSLIVSEASEASGARRWRVSC